MDATLVPMRMRIHSRSAIHKQAELRQSQADWQECVDKPATSIAAESGSVISLCSQMVRAASNIAGTGIQQPQQKRRRLCGQPFTHDHRICSLGIIASTPATADFRGKEPDNNVTGRCESWLTAVTAVAAPKVAAHVALVGSKLLQQRRAWLLQPRLGGA